MDENFTLDESVTYTAVWLSGYLMHCFCLSPLTLLQFSGEEKYLTSYKEFILGVNIGI